MCPSFQVKGILAALEKHYIILQKAPEMVSLVRNLREWVLQHKKAWDTPEAGSS